jgi:hypothetical protein
LHAELGRWHNDTFYNGLRAHGSHEKGMARSRKGHGEVKKRAWRGQEKSMARSRKKHGEVKKKAWRGQEKGMARSIIEANGRERGEG